MIPPRHTQDRGLPEFEPTRWSVVLRTREEKTEARRRALGELCSAYWYPLYAFLRRSGHSAEDAEDLTQEFFLKLQDGSLLSSADPAKGRFRTLLLAAVKNLEINTWRASTRQKRGGGVKIVPLDAAMAEERWQAEPSGGLSEALFDRAWANTVMDRAGARLQAEYVTAGKAALFSELFPRLNGGTAVDGLATVGERLGMTEASVKMVLSRMRPRYADALRAEISETVGSFGDVEDELRYLLKVFL
jgi:RNA polymerase sigma-70 factor (ECF subfamily)